MQANRFIFFCIQERCQGQLNVAYAIHYLNVVHQDYAGAHSFPSQKKGENCYLELRMIVYARIA